MTDAESTVQAPPLNSRALLIVALTGAIAVAAGILLTSGIEVDLAAIVLLFLLTALGLGIFRLASRDDPEHAILFQVLLLAWMARLIGMAFKLYIFREVVGGVADAAAYHREGENIAQMLAFGQLPDLSRFWGSNFVELVTGLMYVITGPTLVGGWIVFNFLALLGMLLHYKAFVIAAPNWNRKLFILLIFFVPTLLMWTNTVGKDALMAFFLGTVTYGVASLYRRGLSVGPLLLTLLGLGGVTLVRPHVGAIVVAALTASVFLLPLRAGLLTPFVRLVMLAAVVVLAVSVIRAAASFINLEDLSVEGISTFAQEEGGESTQQGSLAFEGGGLPTTPKGAIRALLTVLFRPFPWETGNPLILATSLEGVGLIALLLYRIRWIGRAILATRRNSYLIFVVLFAVLFIAFFSTISNFGILIRQRAQLLPFVFVLVAFWPTFTKSPAEPSTS